MDIVADVWLVDLPTGCRPELAYTKVAQTIGLEMSPITPYIQQSPSPKVLAFVMHRQVGSPLFLRSSRLTKEGEKTSTGKPFEI